MSHRNLWRTWTPESLQDSHISFLLIVCLTQLQWASHLDRSPCSCAVHFWIACRCIVFACQYFFFLYKDISQDQWAELKWVEMGGLVGGLALKSEPPLPFEKCSKPECCFQKKVTRQHYKLWGPNCLGLSEQQSSSQTKNSQPLPGQQWRGACGRVYKLSQTTGYQLLPVIVTPLNKMRWTTSMHGLTHKMKWQWQ